MPIKARGSPTDGEMLVPKGERRQKRQLRYHMGPRLSQGPATSTQEIWGILWGEMVMIQTLQVVIGVYWFRLSLPYNLTINGRKSRTICCLGPSIQLIPGAAQPKPSADP